MYISRVQIEFDAGHRILGYSGKCRSPHGHRYRAEVFVITEDLDPVGFSLDLAAVKAPLKAWIDEHWDHGFLLNASDTVLLTALTSVPEAKVFVLKRGNPSAELMAHELFDVATGALGLPVTRVRVWDTPNQYSEYVPTGSRSAKGRATIERAQHDGVGAASTGGRVPHHGSHAVVGPRVEPSPRT
jgi:6-pyruvoyltetrahydropterin/6-carboxytetrahydropterin synthase